MERSILIKDETNGKLFFAIDLLKRLSQSTYKILVEDSLVKEYKNLMSLFPQFENIRNPKPIADVQLSIVISNGKNSNVNYILNNREMEYSSNIGDLLDNIERILNKKGSPRNILISCGPTIEDIDPVRFISNRSSGKMGVALARVSFVKGDNVRLVCGPITIHVPEYLEIVKVRSAAQMANAVLDNFAWCDCFYSVAAVADYTPLKIADNKIKKGEGDLNIAFKRTSDILMELKVKKTNQCIVGFSVETENLFENSISKLKRKGLDVIIANNPKVKGAGFEVDTNQVNIITKESSKELPLMSKLETAQEIIKFVNKLN